jgi:hypothetical protein
MTRISYYIDRLKSGLAMMLLAALPGCVGYAGGYGGGGPEVGISGPEVGIYGGFYDRGPDVHAFHDRGFRSRAVAHSGGGRRK